MPLSELCSVLFLSFISVFPSVLWEVLKISYVGTDLPISTVKCRQRWREQAIKLPGQGNALGVTWDLG